jgi:hypothetical protein
VKLAAIVFAAILAILIGAHIHYRYAMCELYDPSTLVGRSPDDVRSILGKPFRGDDGDEADASWLYQESMEPKAVVTFRNGQVVEVEFLYWSCPPFGLGPAA